MKIVVLFLFGVVAVGVIVAYILPTIIAFVRGAESLRWIVALNILYGWSGAVWAGCLVWALCGDKAPKSDEDEPEQLVDASKVIPFPIPGRQFS